VLERVPIRWRLAGTSALLTLVILCVFAVAIGTLTASRIRSDFNHQTQLQASNLRDTVRRKVHVNAEGQPSVPNVVHDFSNFERGIIRISYAAQPQLVVGETRGAELIVSPKSHLGGKYLIVTKYVRAPGVKGHPATKKHPAVKGTPGVVLLIQYARPESDVSATISRVRLFLILGVLGGAGLALGAGLLLARRAMKPIGDLTSIARHIAQTRDPSEHVPVSAADDEIGLLGRTLDQMLEALAGSRAETEALLKRQRRFVADASHELRTPLTSVLANLELLADQLDGEQGEAARSALRSSQRMRRLVADLLLLARADARRPVQRGAVDMGQVLIEAAGELGAVADEHELSVDARPAWVEGSLDDLHRLVVNLIENAIKHTPPGTRVLASVEAAAGIVVVRVTDDGPGIDPEMRDQIFERFVRGAGDRGGSFGLGLSIVRAVAEQHGGSVVLAPTGGGARFVVTLPEMSADLHRGETERRAPVGEPAGPLA
jgi:two-component system, OmpR family, sensor kinase